ncbi:Synaptic vesicle glycoprotein 2B [Eumeta japonica]|uniref:Synaptic vesicle glycoprotein 2B n=1 Tax=Eumeta variegata TaxID=151549 RepID=A0A4C1URK8_EUMVA|nr:Synaptic vesicle glycoprotein 2B [Eumeta japonica]
MSDVSYLDKKTNDNEMKNVENKLKMEVEGSHSLEDALELSGVGRYSYVLFIICSYSLMSAISEIFGVGVIATSAQCDLQLDLYRKGIIGSLPVLGVMSSGHLWGYIADTRGRKRTLIVTMGGTFLLATISSFSFHWIFLAFMKFLSAVFAAGTNAVMYALLGESTPESQRAKFLLYAATGVMCSQSVMAAIAYPILRFPFTIQLASEFTYRPWRLLTQAYGLMSGINLLLLLVFVHESPKFYLSKGKHKEGLAVLARIFAVNTGRKPMDYPVKQITFDEEVAGKEERNILKSIWAQTVPLLKNPHIKNTMLMFYTSIVVYTIGPAFIVWLPDILNAYVKNIGKSSMIFCDLIQTNAQPNAQLDSNTSVSNAQCDDHVKDLTLALMAGNGLYLFTTTGSLVFIVKCVGKRWTFIGVHILCTAAGFLLNVVTGLGSVLVFIIMISNVICLGITTTYAVELFPTYLRATAVCLTMMVGRIVSFLVINIIGPLVKSNCLLLFNGIAIFILTGSIAGWFLPSDKRKCNNDNVKKAEQP